MFWGSAVSKIFLPRVTLRIWRPVHCYQDRKPYLHTNAVVNASLVCYARYFLELWHRPSPLFGKGPALPIRGLCKLYRFGCRPAIDIQASVEWYRCAHSCAHLRYSLQHLKCSDLDTLGQTRSRLIYVHLRARLKSRSMACIIVRKGLCHQSHLVFSLSFCPRLVAVEPHLHVNNT